MADGTIKIAVDLDVSSLEAALGQIGDLAGKSVSSASKAAGDSTGKAQDAGKQIAKSLSDAFSGAAKSAETAFKNIGSNGSSFRGIQEGISSTEKAAQGFGKSIPGSVQTPLAKAAQAGQNSIQNLAKSMTGGGFPASVKTAGDMLGAFGDSVLTLASAEVPAANDAMGIFSYAITGASGALNGIALGISAYQAMSAAACAVTTTWSAAVQVLNAMEAAHALTLVASNGGLTVMQTIVGVLTGQITLQTAATGLATKAQALFSAAVNSTFVIIGAVIAAVALLVVGIMALYKALNKETEEEKEYRAETERMKQATEDACEANKQFNDSIRSGQSQRKQNLQNSQAEIQAAETLATKLFDLADKENKTTAEKEQMQAIVDRLNKELPDLGLSFDAETGALNKNREEVLKNIAAKKELAQQNAAMDMMTEAYKDQFKAEAQLTSLKQMKTGAEKEYQELVDKSSKTDVERDRAKALQSDIEKLDAQIKDATSTVLSSANEVAAANDLYAQSFNDAGESVQTSQQKIVDACKNGAAAAGTATGDVRSQVKTFLETMQTDSSTYGQDFITAWTNALQTASPEALGSVEAFVAYVLSTMDKTPEFGNIASAEAGAYAAGVGAGMDGAAQAAEAGSTETVENLDKADEAGEKGAETGKSYTANIECEFKAAPDIADEASSEAAEKLDKSGKAAQAGENTAAAFAKGLSQGKSQAAQAFSDVLSGIKSGGSLESFAEDMRGYGYDSLAKLAAGMGESEGFIAQKLADVSGMTVDAVKAMFAQDGATEAQNSAKTMMSSAGSAIEAEGQTVMVQAGNVGLNIARGIAAGIGVGTPYVQAAARDAVQQAVIAAKDEGIIQSPSKLFKKEVGEMLTAGIVVGIEGTAKRVAKAMTKTVRETVAQSEKAAEIGKIVGDRLMEYTAAGIQENSEEATEKFDRFYEQLETRRDFDQISEVDYYAELARLRDTYLSVGTKEWYEYSKKIYDYEQEMVEEHKEAIMDLYDEMADYAKERQDEVLDMQADMEKKLKGFGSLYDTTEYNLFGQKVELAA